MQQEAHLDERLHNLSENYRRYEDGNELISRRNGLTIVRQKRLFGQCVHYAVIGNVPIAYCAGHDVKRPSGRRFVITSTFVHPDHRRQGVARSIYTAIIDEGITLVSDYDLSDGAKALWASLLREEPFRDVFQFQNGYVAKRRGRNL